MTDRKTPSVPSVLERLTTNQRHVLTRVEWAMGHFDGLGSGGTCPRRVFVALERRGLLERIEAVECDGDGFTVQPERWKPAWRLTADGRAALRELEREGKSNG